MEQNLYKTGSRFQKSYEEFGKLQTSSGKSKKLKFNGLHLSKSYIPSPKTLFTDLSNITFNYLCENSTNSLCHFWNHNSFFTTQLVYIFLAPMFHTFDRNIPSKCKFSDFWLLQLKFTKFINFLMSLLYFLAETVHDLDKRSPL